MTSSDVTYVTQFLIMSQRLMHQTVLQGNVYIRTPPHLFPNTLEQTHSLDSTEKDVCVCFHQISYHQSGTTSISATMACNLQLILHLGSFPSFPKTKCSISLRSGNVAGLMEHGSGRQITYHQCPLLCHLLKIQSINQL